MTGAVQVHVLLGRVQTDPLAVAAGCVDLAAVCWYAAGLRRLAARGRRWPVSATAAFVVGIGMIWVAVGSGLAAYDDVDAAVHVVQHVLLMMVVPPLIALGKPITLASQAARRPTQVRILRIVHSRVAAALTFPVAGWLVYYGSMYACFLDRRVYDYLVNHPLAHDGSHVLLLAIGYLYWQPLLGGDPTRWRLSHHARMRSMLAGTVTECVLGVTLMTTRHSLDQVNTLGDTHAAGAVFLALAPLTCALCARLVSRRQIQQTKRPVERSSALGFPLLLPQPGPTLGPAATSEGRDQVPPGDRRSLGIVSRHKVRPAAVGRTRT